MGPAGHLLWPTLCRPTVSSSTGQTDQCASDLDSIVNHWRDWPCLPWIGQYWMIFDFVYHWLRTSSQQTKVIWALQSSMCRLFASLACAGQGQQAYYDFKHGPADVIVHWQCSSLRTSLWSEWIFDSNDSHPPHPIIIEGVHKVNNVQHDMHSMKNVQLLCKTKCNIIIMCKKN
jgi:hypothetical protein